MNETIIDIIKEMLAPGLMISACGLLLLGMNNKYSLVVNRIRTLNKELRTNDVIEERRANIFSQVQLLIIRMRIIRNAVWLYTIAIGLFIFSIFSLGFYLLEGRNHILTIISLILFVGALLCVFCGVMYAAKEVMLGYKIVRIETKNIK